jgi:hypothetical protein
MLEQELRELFAHQTTGDDPPIRASIARAASDGRAQRRKHRVETAVAAAFLAVAVVALSAILPGRLFGSTPPASGAAAPKYFSPLRPYAAFGWLPSGSSAPSGLTNRISLTVISSGPVAGVDFDLYSAGRCHLVQHDLTCLVASGQLVSFRLGRQAGQVRGHPAYLASTRDMPAWPSGLLTSPDPTQVNEPVVWQYARGGWAAVLAEGRSGSLVSTELKVARRTRLGPTVSPPIRFPYQLKAVPSDWFIAGAGITWHRGVPIAGSYNVTAGPSDNPLISPAPRFDVASFQAPTTASCYRSRGSTSTRFGAFTITVTQGGPDPGYWLCAKNADGTVVYFAEALHERISPVNLFEHHLRLLGLNPADWTTEPIAAPGY